MNPYLDCRPRTAYKTNWYRYTRSSKLNGNEMFGVNEDFTMDALGHHVLWQAKPEWDLNHLMAHTPRNKTKHQQIQMIASFHCLIN